MNKLDSYFEIYKDLKQSNFELDLDSDEDLAEEERQGSSIFQRKEERIQGNDINSNRDISQILVEFDKNIAINSWESSDFRIPVKAIDYFSEMWDTKF